MLTPPPGDGGPGEQAMTQWLGLRREDRRDTAIAFLTLTLVMAAHAVLETARDVLFLESLPAERLPWAYLGIAALAVAATKINQRIVAANRKRRVLGLSLCCAAAVTAGFWFLLAGPGDAILYAFYVWTGLLATVAVVQFWVMVGAVVTVAQAKRTFGVVAAGGVVGATLGSLVADQMVQVLSPRHLLLGAVLLLLAAAPVPRLLRRATAASADAPPRRVPRRNMDLLRSQPYLRRLLLLVLVSTVVLTGVDWVFKSAVVAEVPQSERAAYFARFYLTVNAIALVVQVFVSGRLLRSAGVSRALLVLPVLLLFGVSGVGAGAGVVAHAAFLSILLLKGADGSLRHSVHRTATEVLYVPLPTEIRERFKAFIDVVGQRGGQAIASLSILGAVSLGAGISQVTMAAGLLVVVWLVVALDIKRHYLDLFRGNLRAGTIETRVHLAELDLHSLEALLGALNSDEDGEVLAALDLFEQHRKVHLVPVLVLYHPSRAVVLRALELFARHGRRDFVRVARRLLAADDAQLRAAILRALTTIEPDPELLRQYLVDESPLVHTTALVGLVANDFGDTELLEDDLMRHAHDDEASTRVALARAIRHQRDKRFAPYLMRLAQTDSVEVRYEVALSMEAIPDERYLPVLLEMLAVARLRPAARPALTALGQTALYFLDEALWDTTLPRAVRRHLPRTIHRFEPTEAADILMRHLAREDDGTVHYKILRALGRLKTDNPGLKLDRVQLRAITRRTVERRIQLLEWYIATRDAQTRDPRRATKGGELLLAMLREKEQNASERIFRLLGLQHPAEDFELLYQGLRRSDRRARAGSRELLENVLTGPVGAAILALVDDVDDDTRLAHASAALRYRPDTPDYEARLSAMLEDSSEAVQSIAAYHIAELGLTEMVARLRSVRPGEPGVLSDVIDRAVAMLDPDSKLVTDPHAA